MRQRKINETLPDPLLSALRVFGDDLSAARRARRLSQHSLAGRMNVGRRTVMRMERGDPSVSMASYASAAWIMGLEKKLLNSIASEHDPVQQREARLGLPERINPPRRKTMKPDDAGTDTEIAADHSGLDF